MDENVARTAAMVSKIYARAVEEAQEIVDSDCDSSLGHFLRLKWQEVRLCREGLLSLHKNRMYRDLHHALHELVVDIASRGC
jgi:hypothetical protein